MIGVREPGDVARRIIRVDRDGGLEGSGPPGDALTVEYVSGAVDDQGIFGAVAVCVGHEWRGVRSCGKLAGVCEDAVAVAQKYGDVAGVKID